MPAGTTYEPIVTTTLSSNTNTVTFSSISQSYTDLILVFSGANTANSDIRIQLNNDTAGNYSRTMMFGYSGGTISGNDSNLGYWTASSYINRGNAVIQIMAYTNTTKFKTALIRNDISTDIVYASTNLWRSTAAVNSITLSQPTHNFVAGSTFTIYGIAAA